MRTRQEPAQKTSRLSCQISQKTATSICLISDNAEEVMAIRHVKRKHPSGG
jgi:hypothetical protein